MQIALALPAASDPVRQHPESAFRIVAGGSCWSGAVAAAFRIAAVYVTQTRQPDSGPTVGAVGLSA